MTPVAIGDTRSTPLPAEERVLAATLRCIGRWGVAKTTLDDVAREAGCSRATVYRLFPGGKDALLERLAQVEVARFFGTLSSGLAAAADLEDVLVTGMTEAARTLLGHQALQFLLLHEPETVLPRLAFRRFDEILHTVADFAAPHLERWLDPTVARRTAELVTRLVVSYTTCPSEGVDMANEESVRQLVRTFVLPGLTPQGVPA